MHLPHQRLWTEALGVDELPEDGKQACLRLAAKALQRLEHAQHLGVRYQGAGQAQQLPLRLREAADPKRLVIIFKPLADVLGHMQALANVANTCHSIVELIVGNTQEHVIQEGLLDEKDGVHRDEDQPQVRRQATRRLLVGRHADAPHGDGPQKSRLPLAIGSCDIHQLALADVDEPGAVAETAIDPDREDVKEHRARRDALQLLEGQLSRNVQAVLAKQSAYLKVRGQVQQQDNPVQVRDTSRHIQDNRVDAAPCSPELREQAEVNHENPEPQILPNHLYAADNLVAQNYHKREPRSELCIVQQHPGCVPVLCVESPNPLVEGKDEVSPHIVFDD
mmetsp:Transcript_116578/g.228722  ORF Transcript_116578/g.228722 Transcript_116578/m.228722 type:complete len:336 (-) Transcript_116578:41-1048(-)